MTEVVKTIHRLSPETLAAVRQQAGGQISLNHNTTPTQAGFQLGVQHVLNILQQGFTTTSSSPVRE